MAKGMIFKFHNDLDTDQIIASQYLLLPNLEEIERAHIRVSRPGFPQKSKTGRFCCRRRELRLRFFQRTGTGCLKGSRRTGCCCEILREDLL